MSQPGRLFYRLYSFSNVRCQGASGNLLSPDARLTHSAALHQSIYLISALYKRVTLYHLAAVLAQSHTPTQCRPEPSPSPNISHKSVVQLLVPTSPSAPAGTPPVSPAPQRPSSPSPQTHFSIACSPRLSSKRCRSSSMPSKRNPATTSPPRATSSALGRFTSSTTLISSSRRAVYQWHLQARHQVRRPKQDCLDPRVQANVGVFFL